MSFKFNRVFLIANMLLLMLVIFSVALVSKSMEAPEQLSAAAGEPLAGGRILGDTVQPVAQSGADLDVFLNPQFLNIESSIVSSPVRPIVKQIAGAIAGKPLAPTNVQLRDSQNGQSVVLTWDKLSAPESRVRVNRSETSAPGSTVAEVSDSKQGYYDFDVQIGKTYYYTLISFDADGHESAPAGPYMVGPVKDLVAPPAPTNITIISGAASATAGLTINWVDPLASDLNYINIYRSTEIDEIGKNIAQVSPNTETYTDNQAVAGEQYYYLLTSEDKAGNESQYRLGIEAETGNKTPLTPLF